MAASAVTMANNDALVTVLFAAFATFTAFGAAIVGFLAAGGAVQSLVSWWTQRGKDKPSNKRNWASRIGGTLKFRWVSVAWAVGGITFIIVVVIVISGIGLVLCFIWLDAYSHNAVAGIHETYRWIIRLFWIEAFLLTLATGVAVVAAALSALATSRLPDKASAQADKARAQADEARARAESAAELDAALTRAALSWLDSHG
jgi:hypothetical protein